MLLKTARLFQTNPPSRLGAGIRILFSLLLFAAGRLSAQEEQTDLEKARRAIQQDSQDVAQVVETHTHLVTIHALAIGARLGQNKLIPSYEQIVTGLEKPEYYRVLDGGHWIENTYVGGKETQVETVYYAKNVPIRLGIVLETSDWTGPAQAFYKEHVSQMVRKDIRPIDSYFLLAYNDQVNLLKDFNEPGPHDVGKLLKEKKVKWKGKYPKFREAVSSALEKLSAQDGIVKKVLIILGAAPESVTRNSNANFTADRDILNLARKSNTQIVIFPLEEGSEQTIVKKNSTWIGSSLAALTGGLIFLLSKDDFAQYSNMQDYLQRRQTTSAQWRQIYLAIQQEPLIGFYVPETESTHDTWRDVSVEINEKHPEVVEIRKHAAASFDRFILNYPKQYYIPESSESDRRPSPRVTE